MNIIKFPGTDAAAVVQTFMDERRSVTHEQERAMRLLFAEIDGFYKGQFVQSLLQGTMKDGRDVGVANAMNVWARHLAEFPADVLPLALKQCVEDNPRFAPSLAEFMAACRVAMARRPSDLALRDKAREDTQQWDMTVEQAREHSGRVLELLRSNARQRREDEAQQAERRGRKITRGQAALVAARALEAAYGVDPGAALKLAQSLEPPGWNEDEELARPEWINPEWAVRQ